MSCYSRAVPDDVKYCELFFPYIFADFQKCRYCSSDRNLVSLCFISDTSINSSCKTAIIQLKKEADGFGIVARGKI